MAEEEMPKHRGAVPILGVRDGFWVVSLFSFSMIIRNSAYVCV
jgi:hypothetical protein